MLRLGLDQPVLLIGAGICGLAIAHGLQEANIPFCIFDTEDDSTAQSTDWQIACHSGMPMLKKLLSENIADRLDVDAIVDPTLDCNRYTGCAFERSGGELVGEVAADGECLRISRAKFRSMCCEGVDIEYGHTLEAIELIEHGQIVAIFANGKRQVGSMVIGADGPNSTVREILFGRKRAQINPTDATWMPSPWHTRGGRMTLAGDAAHTMAHNGERGLENALVDAHNLVATIKNIVAGNLVRAAAIPSYSLEVAARGAKEVEASRDIADSILDAGSLDKRGLIPRITATTPGNPAPKATRARRAWSHARLWMVGKVENLDRGAREGTAQTGWAQLGQRAYGRSHFPPDSM